MYIELENGEILEKQIGFAMCGIGIVSAIFTQKDVQSIHKMDQLKLGKWIQSILACKFLPAVCKSKLINYKKDKQNNEQ